MITSEAHDRIREDVSKAYAAALRRAQAGAGGCCGPSRGDTRGVAPLPAGYGTEATALPGAAAQASFGCGNPLALAGIREGETLLDLGSGAGLDLLLASRMVGASGRVIGVDMTEEMIEAARRSAAEAGAANVELRRGLIEALPVEDGSVDRVISNCVINLSPDKPAVFREIRRVLRPGGSFSIADIVVEHVPWWLRRSVRARAACLAGAIPEEAYRAGLERAGLVGVEVADRLVHGAAELRSLAGSALDALGLPRALVRLGSAAMAGKVASVRFIGRRPE